MTYTITDEEIKAILADGKGAAEAANTAGHPDEVWITVEASLIEGMASRLRKAEAALFWNTNMEEAPEDGTVIYVRKTDAFKFTLYKPNSDRRKKGILGRWQKSNGYGGFENCELPGGDWCLIDKEGKPLPTPPQEGE